ncbi:MAG: glycerol-3-phosphate dehydrogenase/oxidase [Bdellovibrionales bacterium]|nr:glycerol-3-phosphate dehydrogenase/oxidase [Bdellovibrionales bacterium]
MKKFSSIERSQNLNKFKNEIFDLVIVGGGINGAGIARDASSRGMKVALIEANDFASGTSSRSSKLIHGGIRYLENLEFKLVFEALNERSILFEIAPHLVHPLKFMIPLFKASRVGMFKMGLGMWLYDILSLFQTPELHERLTATQTLSLQEQVKSKDLLGSFVYYDAYMDDDRLVHETLRSANENKAIIANYVSAKEYSYEESIHKIKAIDTLTGQSFEIKSHQMISCVGPWTDFFAKITDDKWENLLRPTKGIHLILKRQRFNLHQAVVMGAETGNRIIFGIPRGEFVIIGTTDTDYPMNPSTVHTELADVEYLLKIVNSYFPNEKIEKADIVASYSGVRPLVHDKAQSTGKTSREHTIKSGKNGIIYVAGGKYTTYRKIAEEAVDRLLEDLSIEQRVLFSKSNTHSPLNPLVTSESYRNYLSVQVSKEDFKLAELLGPEAEVLKHEYPDYTNLQKIVAFHIDNTMCISIADFYLRRSHLMLTLKDHGLSQFDEIAMVFRDKLDANEEFIQSEKEKIQKHINSEMGWMVLNQ